LLVLAPSIGLSRPVFHPNPGIGQSRAEASIDRLLKRSGGSLRLLGCRYNGPVMEEAIPFTAGMLDMGTATWNTTTLYQAVEGDSEAYWPKTALKAGETLNIIIPVKLK
jgi:hypothetical protein